MLLWGGLGSGNRKTQLNRVVGSILHPTSLIHIPTPAFPPAGSWWKSPPGGDFFFYFKDKEAAGAGAPSSLIYF